jgi:propanol-preferring alcohol dehydrogenase
MGNADATAMRAMVLVRPGEPLERRDIARPRPSIGEVLLRVRACGVCRTDLHVLDGELPPARLPITLGHQIVGIVEAVGPGAGNPVGARVGVPWLGWTCGECPYCARGQENLCDRARFTGHGIDGGFAEYAVADARYCFPIPEGYPDLQAAPLLCAGLIGFRALRMVRWARRLGLYGFGSAAHVLTQVARWQHREVSAITRPGDHHTQAFARRLGAAWAGSADEVAPGSLDAAIVFASDGALVPAALRAVRKGGIVVCAGIHMSDIPAFPYRSLWEERVLRSVANLTRRDAEEFLALAPRVPVHTEVTAFPLDQANEALACLRAGASPGSIVLAVS